MKIKGAERIVGPGAHAIAEYVMMIAKQHDFGARTPSDIDPSTHAELHDVVDADAQVMLRWTVYPEPALVIRSVTYNHADDDLG